MGEREMREKLAPCPFCGGEAEIERVGDARQSTIYSCTDCGCRLETGETFNHGAAWNRRASPPAAVPDGWNKLLLAAKILYQNAEGCAVNHHEVDFKAFGLPGWLADCKRDIENAEASLAMTTAAAPVQEPVAWADFADNGNIRLWTKTSEQLRAQLETDAGRKMQPLYASPAPTVKHVEGLKAAIRAAKLALFLMRKRGVIPNASWESGFNRDLEIAENALSASPATTTASDGWVMVPREPTPDMANAGDEYMPLFREWPEYAGLTGADVAVDVYRAMISAAPAAPIVEPPEGQRDAVALIRWAHDTLYEINPSNYDHDEVCRLNDASVEVILGLARFLGERQEAVTDDTERSGAVGGKR